MHKITTTQNRYKIKRKLQDAASQKTWNLHQHLKSRILHIYPQTKLHYVENSVIQKCKEGIWKLFFPKRYSFFYCSLSCTLETSPADFSVGRLTKSFVVFVELLMEVLLWKQNLAARTDFKLLETRCVNTHLVSHDFAQGFLSGNKPITLLALFLPILVMECAVTGRRTLCLVQATLKAPMRRMWNSYILFRGTPEGALETAPRWMQSVQSSY